MAEGLPVIASDIIEINSLVQDNHNGFLYNAHCRKSLVSLLETVPVGDTQWDSLSERALFTAQKYSISNMVNAYEELYADIFR